MGRGKVQMRRIEDKSSRQVTFSKRRGGLMKKALELSVLCDVDVATFVFSGRGRVYEFCNGDSLRKVLERYQIHPGEEIAACKSVNEATGDPAECTGIRKDANLLQMVQSCDPAECTGLRTDANLLKMVQSHLMELNNEHLNITELTQLENQLDSTLRQTRLKKTQLMMNAATESYVKENQLMIQDNLQMEMEIAALMNNEDPQPT